MMVIKINPMPAPRLNYKSRFNPKKKDLFWRYVAYKEEIRKAALENGFDQSVDNLHVVFTIPMPRSWSKKKRENMCGRPHQQTPDTDNLVKALKDALFAEDKHVWRESQEKIWGKEGSIYIK